MKVFSDPEVDSLVHLLIRNFSDPLYVTVTRPDLVSWTLLENFTHLPREGELAS